MRCAIVITFVLVQALCRAAAPVEDFKDVVWKDAKELTLEGKAFADTKAPYDRLPGKAEGVVPKAVWGLSRDSAGMTVRFVSDSPSIYARWTVVKENLAMPHMAATGVSGLDLYARDEKGQWKWVAVGKPTAKTNTVALINALKPGEREYLVYLPLYNGTEQLEIGVKPNTKLTAGPARDAQHAKPILFWGTSITHGACASRPGMCHPAIIGRNFDRPVVNLGFSGNGKMDPEVTALLAELDPAVYVIDCLPNMDAKLVSERTEPLVNTLRKARPETPIVLVEDRNYADSWIVENKAQRNSANQAALKAAYEKLKAEGVKKLFYVETKDLLGDDREDTVDSSHPNDLGFVRQAAGIGKVVGEALK
jgi:hypothetical protein